MNRKRRPISANQIRPRAHAVSDDVERGIVLARDVKPNLLLRIFATALLSPWILKRVRNTPVENALLSLAEFVGRSEIVQHFPERQAVNFNNAVGGGNVLSTIERCRMAVVLNPNSLEAHHDLGLELQSAGFDAEAITHYRHAIALDAHCAPAYNNLGNSLYILGLQQKAIEAYSKAVAIDPLPKYYRNLSNVKRFSEDDVHLAAMVQIAQSSLSSGDRMELSFALGKAYDDIGNYDQAFRYFLEGNRLKRASLSYDEAANLEIFARIKSVFTRQLINEKRGSGHASDAPLFVIGMPRSGTTLIEQIISSHPAVHGAGELDLFEKAALHESCAGASADVRREAFLQSLEQGDDVGLREIGLRYCQAIRLLSAEADRIVDKRTSNFLYVGLIHLALPNARIIHIRRNAADTCLSCFSKLFTESLNFTYDLTELGRSYAAYADLMDHWKEVLPPGVMLEVCYEDLVADFETQARRLISFAGLEWDQLCLSFYQNQRPVRTASATQVRKPLYQTSVGKYRLYGAHLQPLLDALYPRV